MAWGAWANRKVAAPADAAQQGYLRNVAGAANRAGWNPGQLNRFGSGINLPNPSESSTVIANNPTVPGVTAAPQNTQTRAPQTTVTPIPNSMTIGGPSAGVKGGNVGISGGGTYPAAVMPGRQAPLVPYHPGEDPAGYMQKMGMSQTDIDAALAASKANPGASFQDITAGYNIPGPPGTVHATDTGYNIQGGFWGPQGLLDPRVGYNTNSNAPQDLYNYTALQNTPAKDFYGRDIGPATGQASQFANPAVFPLTPNQMPGMYPGESTLQYALRMGLDPNQASQYLAARATGN